MLPRKDSNLDFEVYLGETASQNTCPEEQSEHALRESRIAHTAFWGAVRNRGRVRSTEWLGFRLGNNADRFQPRFHQLGPSGYREFREPQPKRMSALCI